MKRDWDVIRKQLIDVEEENDLFLGVPSEPKWEAQSEPVFLKELEEYRTTSSRVFGHFELLVNAGYIDGLEIIRTWNSFAFSRNNPRLTMAGHDLLDTIRSKPVWEKIKINAKEKGIELTFDAIKALGALVLKSLLE